MSTLGTESGSSERPTHTHNCHAVSAPPQYTSLGGCGNYLIDQFSKMGRQVEKSPGMVVPASVPALGRLRPRSTA